MAFFWRGEGTHKVPMSMHRNKRVNLSKALEAAGKTKGAVAFLKGGDEISVYDTDTAWDFKQESNFQYLFGVKEPGCYGCVEASTGRHCLFIPRLPESYAVFMGPVKPTDWFKKEYEVEEARYVDEIVETLKEWGVGDLLTYHGKNRDSGLELPAPTFDGIDQFKVDNSELLWNTLAELRVIKCQDEVELLGFCCKVSSLSHIHTMRRVRPNTREFLSEAEFRYQSMLRGCARCGYNCIAPAGERNVVLHYGHAAEPNQEVVLPGQLKLHDMGAEYHCYTSDVTCTFPVDGVFTEHQRIVYGAVWAATQAVERTIKPGVNYQKMHRLSERVLLEHLKEAGVVKGEIADMEKVFLANSFMPHGLGHCLGLDCHDVGGYPPGENRSTEPGLASLRCGRDLMENMVITVEPGLYFNPYCIEEALKDENKRVFLNEDRLREFKNVGGVRIEDDVVITSDGCKVLNSVPREIDDVERVLAGADWDAPLREYHN